METQKLIKVKSNLQTITDCLKNQNSGADVHAVNNMRQTASLLLAQLEEDPDCMHDDLVNQIVSNLECKLIEFYRKKYPSHSKT